MTHKQLIFLVAQRSGICPATIEHVLPVCFDIIRETVITGQYHGSVRLDGFGTFYAQNRRSNVADPQNPGQRIQGYRLTPKFTPTTSFKQEVECEQVNPGVHSFQYTDGSQVARHPRNRKYHFRSVETRQRMSAIGKANKQYILDANRQRLQRIQTADNMRGRLITREELRSKSEN